MSSYLPPQQQQQPQGYPLPYGAAPQMQGYPLPMGHFSPPATQYGATTVTYGSRGPYVYPTGGPPPSRVFGTSQEIRAAKARAMKTTSLHPSMITHYLNVLQQDFSVDEKRYAVIALRKVLEVKDRVYCTEFVQTYAGHLPVIELLCNGDAGGKANAAAVLRLLAQDWSPKNSGTGRSHRDYTNDTNESLNTPSYSKETLVKAGVIPPLIALLRDGDADGKEQAVAALCKLAEGSSDTRADCADDGFYTSPDRIRAALAAAGSFKPLVDILGDGNAATKSSAAMLLMEMTIQQGSVVVSAFRAIPVLVALLLNGEDMYKGQMASMLKELAGQSHDNAIAIVQGGAVPALVALSHDRNAYKKTEAAAALKSLASNGGANSDVKGAIVAAGGPPRFSVGDHVAAGDRACVVQGVHGVDEGRYRYRVLFEDGSHEEDVAESRVRLRFAAGALVDADRGETGTFCAATVEAARDDGYGYDVAFDDGGREERVASCRVRKPSSGFRKTGSPWIGRRLKKGGFLGFVVAWKPPVGDAPFLDGDSRPAPLYGVAYYGNTNVEELQAHELLDARLLLPQTPDEWQRDRAFAEFLRVRDVACECNDPYASVTTIQAFFDLGGTAEGTAEMLLEGIHGQHCTVPNIQDLWKEYCAGGVPAPAETADADAEEAETGRLGELEAKVRALEIANATLETENAALAGRLKEETERADDQGTTAMYLTAQKSELQDLVSEAVGALVEWNVPTKDVPDDDAPFYYMFDSHRADNMQTLPWNPYAGIPMTIGEGIHWILNQKERETKKRPRR